MTTKTPTAPTRAHSRSLDLPAVIAGSANLLKLSEALTRAGLIGRYDPDRGMLVIEPAAAAPVIPFPRRAADPVAEDAAGMAWFNSLSRDERAHWLDVAWRRNERAAGHGSYTLQDMPSAADAWRAFQSGVAGPL